VKAPADSTADSEAPLPEQISLVLSELHGASGLSPRSKRLLAALAEAATAELTPSATASRLLGQGAGRRPRRNGRYRCCRRRRARRLPLRAARERPVQRHAPYLIPGRRPNGDCFLRRAAAFCIVPP
jgi:hypothetical protein